MGERRRIAVVGIFGAFPFAGMAWMHCQFLAGLGRLGHEVAYLETTDHWPWDPRALSKTNDPGYTLEYLQRVMSRFGLAEHWAYRATCADGTWRGPLAREAVDFLRSADAVLN